MSHSISSLRSSHNLLELPKMQRSLFSGNRMNGTNGFRDSAFARNKELPLHRWVPWVAGCSADFVPDCLDKYLPQTRKSRSWVLDPFAGVGTTLVEAYLDGRNVVGFEINPYAALATRLKLEAVRISPDTLARRISDFSHFMLSIKPAEVIRYAGRSPRLASPEEHAFSVKR